jgi:hypothetical protein
METKRTAQRINEAELVFEKTSKTNKLLNKFTKRKRRSKLKIRDE